MLEQFLKLSFTVVVIVVVVTSQLRGTSSLPQKNLPLLSEIDRYQRLALCFFRKISREKGSQLRDFLYGRPHALGLTGKGHRMIPHGPISDARPLQFLLNVNHLKLSI